MEKKTNKIFIFCHFSKKIGLGHYIRSYRLYDMLKKQHKVFFYSNKTKKFIETKIRNHIQNSIFFFDFKKYENIKLSSSKSTKFIFFDRNKKKKQKK